MTQEQYDLLHELKHEINLSEEAYSIVEKVVSSKDSTFAVQAVAGSGKSTLAQIISKVINPDTVRYIVFSKAMAEEAKLSFPSNVEISTIHSLAYRVVMFRGISVADGSIDDSLKSRKVAPFYITDIEEYGKYNKSFKFIKNNKDNNICEEEALIVRDEMIKYFQSAVTCHYSFSLDIEEKHLRPIFIKYIELMFNNKIAMTHDAYLKYYHILLEKGYYETHQYDLVILDEAQDVTAVSFEVFKLLNTKKWLLVGDSMQNIFSSFMGTINVFDQLPELDDLPLSKSFRVSEEIAHKVQSFCREYLDPYTVLKGTKYQTKDIKTRMIIGRTNTSLIDKMNNLVFSGVQFGLTRDVNKIFGVALTIAKIKAKQKKIKYPNELLRLRNYVMNNKGVTLAHIEEEFWYDKEIVNAVALCKRMSLKQLWKIYFTVKEMAGLKHDLLLSTAHSSKGLTVDEVELLPNMNNSLQEVIEDGEDYSEEARLYYVACTRARYKLINAEFLEKYNE